MTAAPALERVPLNTWAIVFGTAGLAEVWSEAGDSLGWPGAVAVGWWVLVAVAWSWLLVAHLVRGVRTRLPLGPQLRHPAQGPIAALVPVVVILLGGRLAAVSLGVARVLVVAAVLLAVAFAAWLFGRWLTGGLQLDAVHGGYLLPTVAMGFIGAGSLAAVGFDAAGWGLFASGCFFWVVVSTLVVLRLAVRPALPGPLVPTTAILMAPPAVAGLAWRALHGPSADPVALGLAGLTVLMVAVQVALLPRYLALPFSLGFWSFTFPVAAVLADAVAWLRLAGGWRVLPSVAAVTIATALVLAIAGRSLLEVRRSAATAEAALVRADDTDGR